MSEHGEAEADEVESAESEKEAMDVDEKDDVPDTTYPSLETYQLKWERLKGATLQNRSRRIQSCKSRATMYTRVVAELSARTLRQVEKQRCRLQAVTLPTTARLHPGSLC